jgi:uncharacterized coiled-coil DUF342 family protein
MLDRQSLAELADMYKEKYNLLLKDNEELERQIDEANAEVEQLRQQRDEARKRLSECAMDKIAELDKEMGL